MKAWGLVNVHKKVEILSYSPEHRQGTLDVIRSSFFPRELFCKAAQISASKDAEDDLLNLVDDCLSKSKVSLVARDMDTGKIVGASVNLIQIKSTNSDEPSYFETFRDTRCKTENAKALIDFMIEADSFVNIFETYSVESLFEVMFLAALPEYSRHGIGMHLTKHSIELATMLKNGIDCNEYLEPGVLQPKLLTCIATNPTTQKYSKVLGADRLVHEKVSDSFSPKMQKYVDNFEDPEALYQVYALVL